MFQLLKAAGRRLLTIENWTYQIGRDYIYVYKYGTSFLWIYMVWITWIELTTFIIRRRWRQQQVPEIRYIKGYITEVESVRCRAQGHFSDNMPTISLSTGYYNVKQKNLGFINEYLIFQVLSYCTIIFYNSYITYQLIEENPYIES